MCLQVPVSIGNFRAFRNQGFQGSLCFSSSSTNTNGTRSWIALIPTRRVGSVDVPLFRESRWGLSRASSARQEGISLYQIGQNMSSLLRFSLILSSPETCLPIAESLAWPWLCSCCCAVNWLWPICTSQATIFWRLMWLRWPPCSAPAVVYVGTAISATDSSRETPGRGSLKKS